MPDDGFRSEPDLSRAATIPASWYRDPAMHGRERERVFRRSWQLVGRTDQVREPGDFFTCEVAGEPILVARGDDGTLRALSNVCRHRAGPVAEGSGRRRSFRCGYHGWTYALDGSLAATPEWDGVCDFDPARHCLPEFRVEIWSPFVFVHLDADAPPLADSLGAIPEETRSLPLDRMRLFRRVDYEIGCNWKVYVDNYLEGYHIPIVHPGLFRELDYRAYRVETGRLTSKQHAPLRSRAAVEASREALYYWVFPNLMLNVYPDNLQTNVILPLSADRTLTRFEWYVLDPDRAGAADEFERSFAFSDQLQKEDIAICEAVQRGLASQTYESGRYSVRRENGVHHFHGLLSRFLAEEPVRGGASGGA